MSFLRNIRNSISRGNSSARDSTPNSRRSSSIDSNSNRRDSLEIKPDGLQRSETFTLEDEDTMAAKTKSSKAEKVLSKFSTFTKRKKSPVPERSVEQIQRNTYYKWRSGTVADPAEAAMDPFNVLYEQPSSLKSDLSGVADSSSRKKAQIDCATYRKNRIPSHLREQLDQLNNHPEISEETENDPEKFRTVTINSFRKSFRSKYLAAQNQVPHNPAWFVEVEPPPGNSGNDRDQQKNHRPDVFVFENENYRPTSRSPVRKRSPLRNIVFTRKSPAEQHESEMRNRSPDRAKMPVRTTARSAVKRTDTFKVERPLTEPSIRIEIKNSITPNQPGRMVPVGVAKPMPSQTIAQPFRHNRFESPTRHWDHHTPPVQSEVFKPGRYQTCIHITPQNPHNPLTPSVHKESTRIQISGNSRSPLRYITSGSEKRKPENHATRKQTYFGDNIPKAIHHDPPPSSSKSRQYIQHTDAYSYSRPSRSTSGLINRNDVSRNSMTQAWPRRSNSPIKAPWR